MNKASLLPPASGIPAAAGIPPPYGSHRPMGAYPIVPLGGGYLSKLTDRCNAMDFVGGRDRILGKVTRIELGTRQAMGSKHLGNFSTRDALGAHTGPMPQHTYGRFVDTVV